jgi:hypothetical protein
VSTSTRTPAPWINRVAVVAALVIASPVVYRVHQGLLSPSAAFERFAMVFAGCVAVSVLVRTLAPMVMAEPVAPAEAPATPSAEPFDDGFGDFEDFSAFDDGPDPR